MSNIPATREHLYILARNEQLESHILEYALRRIGVIPDSKAWRHFLDDVFLLLGVTLLSIGVVFFFAYNWNDMGRFTKFALLEAGILIMILFATVRGLEHLSAQASVLAASILFGSLLAVYGQTYQTGADAFELFLFWAILIFPWVFVNRFAPLWLLWLILLNVSLILAWIQVVDQSGVEMPIELYLLLFFLNGTALVIWERASNVEWLQNQWLGTTLFIITITTLIIPTLVTIFDFDIIWQKNKLFGPTVGLYVFVTIFSLWYYRYQRHDLLLLAVTLSGVLATLTTLIGMLLPLDEIVLFLFLAILVIGQATLATKWLLHVKNIWKQEDEINYSY
ncbi:DUF2157 domain-containing protein [Thiotrichales bacterium HSG1]|nr:DUF2157 domain-containing protein [Thiotrichales bacterium HSG1]